MKKLVTLPVIALSLSIAGAPAHAQAPAPGATTSGIIAILIGLFRPPAPAGR